MTERHKERYISCPIGAGSRLKNLSTTCGKGLQTQTMRGEGFVGQLRHSPHIRQRIPSRWIVRQCRMQMTRPTTTNESPGVRPVDFMNKSAFVVVARQSIPVLC